MTDKSFSTILVKYRFDGNIESETIPLTLEQYENLKKLPITIECKIVKDRHPTLSKKDIALMNKKLEKVFAKSGHAKKKLSE